MPAISDSQVAAVRRAALNQKYHLLLGAGASLDTCSQNGARLPGANRLAEEIADNFGVVKEDGDLLWRIYDRAVSKNSEAAVYFWLRQKFRLTKPPTWMDSLARFSWDTVWTLNLDDSFERAYSRSRSTASRKLTVRSWDDDFSRGASLPVVHLHGHVDDAEMRRIIFSLTQYSDAAAKRATWPLAFRDTYGNSPFVVIGARLRDEPDIEAIVARRSPEHDTPSFYVSPNLSPAMEDDLRAWNLIPIRATAEEFVKIWEDITQIDASVPPSPPTEHALRFGRQFRELSSLRANNQPSHDLIGGDEPSPIDIEHDVPAAFSWIDSGKSLVRAMSSDQKSGIVLFTGHRLTGRSTGLLCIGKAMADAGWRVFRFEADERPDTEAVLQYGIDGNAVALLFDGLSDIVEYVNKILDDSRDLGLAIACIAVDRSDRNEAILSRVSGTHLVGGKIHAIPGKLRSDDARRLVSKLQSLGRLGQLEPKGTSERVHHFARHELFHRMALLENAPGFGTRVDDIVAKLLPGFELDLAFFASLAYLVDRPLLITDAARMTGVLPEVTIRGIRESEALGALVSTDGQYVRARQRWMALERTIGRLSPVKALELLGSGIRNLSSRISESARREVNASSTLVASLMSYKILNEIFPGQELEAWYADLQPLFGRWSGRYWEQRAIMNRHRAGESGGGLARAESYAQRAVSLRADAYSYTTLGTILIVRAAHEATLNQPTARSYHSRALDAFEEANRLDDRNIVTWMAYLRHSLPLLENLSKRAELDAESWEFIGEIQSVWVRIKRAILSIVEKSDSSHEVLEALSQRFRRVSALLPDGLKVDDRKQVRLLGVCVAGHSLSLDLGPLEEESDLSITWRRNGTVVPNVTTRLYVLQANDVGAYFSVTVQSRLSNGEQQEWKTNAIGPIIGVPTPRDIRTERQED